MWPQHMSNIEELSKPQNNKAYFFYVQFSVHLEKNDKGGGDDLVDPLLKEVSDWFPHFRNYNCSEWNTLCSIM